MTPAQGFEFLGKIATNERNWTSGVFIDRYVYAVQSASVYSAITESMVTPGLSLAW